MRTTTAPPELSRTVGNPKVADVWVFDASFATDAGAVILGGVVSSIVTDWVSFATFPDASVAVQIIV